ncbi:uncharacterized protein LOC105198352 [Solenopsis invicta]|uniref:uncharacterized protein LOC105198352 n=1 Tax=Solenopsis invicta TaxID=13686 RepID=UPI00193D1F82|nr:uncharacterized protein LOC105198352 [Solenopsis invicta]
MALSTIHIYSISIYFYLFYVDDRYYISGKEIKNIIVTFLLTQLCIKLYKIIYLQLTPLIILKCTSKLVAKILSSVSFYTVFVIKHNAFHLKIEVMKTLLMELQYVFNKLKDEHEIAIVEKYSCIGKRFTIGLTAFAFCGLAIGTLTQFWSEILTLVVVSINVSQPNNLLIMTEYFIDQEKYFYLILFHIHSVFCIGCYIMVAVGSMGITYFHHTCGMFTIASYRIEHAVNLDILQNITLKDKILMTEGIINAIDIHRQAMKLCKHMLSALETMLFSLIVCGVLVLSLNLFQIAMIENSLVELFFPSFFVLSSVLYMFMANYMGQIVTDHNNHIFSTAYNVQWYRVPIHVQRMILFLLQRETREFALNVGGLFNASMECFAMLVKASVSYFTVIYSTR